MRVSWRNDERTGKWRKVEVSAAVTLSGDRSLLHRGSNTIQIGCKNRPSSWLSGEDTFEYLHVPESHIYILY